MADELRTVSLEARLWRNTGVVTVLVFLFFVVYVALLDPVLGPASLAKMVAGTSNILLGMSLSLSSFGYHFNFLDSKVIYRKYLGLAGYFAALLYCLLLTIVRPERYFFGFFENLWSSDFMLGFASMAIFTGMALISNDRAMRWIGPHQWRMYLRFGFVAYFLLVVRAILNNEIPIGSEPIPEIWSQYLADPQNLPPARLFFSVVGISVIFFRLSVEFDKWRRKKREVTRLAASPVTSSTTIVSTP